jgi:hypothetical protein
VLILQRDKGKYKGRREFYALAPLPVHFLRQKELPAVRVYLSSQHKQQAKTSSGTATAQIGSQIIFLWPSSDFIFYSS